VGVDDLCELCVAVHKRELDDGVRSRPAQAARLEQLALLFGVEELSNVDVRTDLVPRFQARNLGIDVIGASFSCQGDAMVAVLDEVRPADFEDVDRRHDAVGKCLSQVCQSAARESSLGSEVAAEVGAAVNRPDDAVDRDLLQAEIGAPGEGQSATDLVERD
jgi:hypothetical protein